MVWSLSPEHRRHVSPQGPLSDPIAAFPLVGWSESRSPSDQRRAIRMLEAGKVIFLPNLRFEFSDTERRLLDPRCSGRQGQERQLRSRLGRAAGFVADGRRRRCASAASPTLWPSLPHPPGWALSGLRALAPAGPRQLPAGTGRSAVDLLPAGRPTIASRCLSLAAHARKAHPPRLQQRQPRGGTARLAAGRAFRRCCGAILTAASARPAGHCLAARLDQTISAVPDTTSSPFQRARRGSSTPTQCCTPRSAVSTLSNKPSACLSPRCSTPICRRCASSRG